MNNLIDRQAAIDELVRWGKIPEYGESERNMIACTIGMLSSLPSAEPELSTDVENSLALLDGIYVSGRMEYYSDYCALHDTISSISAEPETKEIGYTDCANTMLKMWIDKVITDGEYNRIMDKLNARWKDG